MNTKNFLISGLIGGIADWLLGWLFYGVLFAKQFPASDDMNMLFITLCCLMFGFIIAYIFVRWAGISTFASGAQAGAILGLMFGLWSNFFRFSDTTTVDYSLFFLDVAIGVVMTAIIGGIVGLVIGKLNAKS